ncbi:MAG TPA: sigma-70 family RNA polymerase sigma factor [Bacilli bacterium]|jgi:RNA polymerase sigma factor (sigma-70 family)|nr:sigma-70 family RNA polymerase sigma factor [Bacilli bacterium]HNZ74301.1 sigma-70 family RNA polymerase sigma factor [Bacilli bacterium]HOC97846.1 sigma-70 family RNA polymerase sigma factor [Bacilli bacterium]HPA98802.1 sigma-70 family RNA polymerase sigma factor [Bacilli bacterium]HPX83216.1 sigma-70 family RNA polymerase sigma factor [Bacilli bacterium]
MFDEIRLKRSMEKLQQGNDEAFEYIYDSTHRLVYYQIYSILKSHQEAENIMQDVYIKVYRNIDKYKNDNPRAWIVTIARNEAINLYHKNKKEVFMDEEELDAFSEEDEKTPLINLAVKILDEEEFLLVAYSVLEGKSRREVAKILDLSPSGVTYKLNLALEKLKKEVA